MAKILVVAFVGILATMYILKARQYRAEVNQKVEISERVIQERDISLKICQSEGTNKDKEIEALKKSLIQVSGERDILMDSENGLTEELVQSDIKVVELENQMSENSISTAEQIQQLQDELIKAQDDLAATLAQPKEAHDKLYAADAHAAEDAAAEGAAGVDVVAADTNGSDIAGAYDAAPEIVAALV